MAEQPPLLEVNRQIRAEACELYYKENEFVWTITDYDAALPIKWQKSSKSRLNSNIRYVGDVVYMKPVWANVMHWLEAYYRDGIDGLGRRRDAPPTRRAVGEMFEIVAMNSGSWEEKKQILERMRHALGGHDARWLEDN